MPNNLAWLFTLAVFSSISMNLILHFGIDLQQVASGVNLNHSGRTSKWIFLIRLGIYFSSVMFLWIFFSLLQSALFLGFFEYILIFPVSSLFFTVITYLAKRLVIKKSFDEEPVSADIFFLIGEGAFNNAANNNAAFTNGALVSVALFIILGLSGGIADALVLSFGFCAGIALVVLISGEIRRRSQMEAVPRCLRGGPLSLITLGLLSLVYSSAAIIFYNILGAR